MSKKIQIPTELMNPSFRFFLVSKGSKIPLEKKWNSINNYQFFHPKLLNWINKGNNYGVLTGFGNLIVLDFDDRDYYKSKIKSIPKTFTVITANKKLFHKYYYLDGDMFNTLGVDVKDKRVCDMMGTNGRVIAPECCFDRKFYTIKDNIPISHITTEQLTEVFKMELKAKKKWDGVQRKANPEIVKRTIKLFEILKIEQCQERHFKCPYHAMDGNGNLYLFDDGGLHCFHCGRTWIDIEQFVIQLEKYNKKK